MTTIEEITSSFVKTYQNVIGNHDKIPLILNDPQYLAKLIDCGEKRRLQNSDKFNTPVPRFCIFSVTWKCNLKCIGCYAKSYSSSGSLTVEDVYSIANQVSDFGCFIFIIAGGEPLTIPNLVETLAKVEGGLFFIFTNGTLITDKIVNQLRNTKNIIPIISIEGDSDFTNYRRGAGVSDKISNAMKVLFDSQIGFGFSAMATHKNLKQVTSREWFEEIWSYGARFGFIIDYIPFQTDLDSSLILTQEDMEFKKNELLCRNTEAKPLVINFPPDEYGEDGCQAAGKGFIHINADGFVEPCPFSHYASDNIKNKKIETILISPFFSEIRKRFNKEKFNGTCLLFEHDKVVGEIASLTNAIKTDKV